MARAATNVPQPAAVPSVPALRALPCSTLHAALDGSLDAQLHFRTVSLSRPHHIHGEVAQAEVYNVPAIVLVRTTTQRRTNT